jgi:hypothetical protein
VIWSGYGNGEADDEHGLQFEKDLFVTYHLKIVRDLGWSVLLAQEVVNLATQCVKSKMLGYACETLTSFV